MENVENWSKEFDEKFDDGYQNMEHIKSFIQQQIEKAFSAGRQDGITENNAVIEEIRQETAREIIEMIPDEFAGEFETRHNLDNGNSVSWMNLKDLKQQLKDKYGTK